MMNHAVLTLCVSALFCSHTPCVAVMYFGIVYSNHVLVECSVGQKDSINCFNCIFKTKIFNTTNEKP